MGSINLGRVVMGGLLTGLIINIGEFVLNVPILGATYEAALADAGLQVSPSEMVIWPVFTFAMGIVAVWVYAAIRPRFGPGPKTAVYAGVVMWLVVMGTFTAQGLALPILPSSAIWISAVWGLVEVPVATVAGAWVYREP